MKSKPSCLLEAILLLGAAILPLAATLQWAEPRRPPPRPRRQRVVLLLEAAPRWMPPRAVSIRR